MSTQNPIHRSFFAAILLGALTVGASAKNKGDIGSPLPEGKAVQQMDNWTITGGGADFTGVSDQFHFASSSASGNCTLTAKIVSVGDDSAHEWAKAALMIRADEGVGSPHASIAIGHGGMVVFSNRSTPGGETRSERATKMSFPIFLRLERKKDDFTSSYSLDGKTWTQVGKTMTVPMKPSVLAGMAVTSHSNGSPCTAVFANYQMKR